MSFDAIVHAEQEFRFAALVVDVFGSYSERSRSVRRMKTKAHSGLGERSVAQSGSALGWGPRGHRFKSCRSDFVDATVCDVMRVVCVCPGRPCNDLRGPCSFALVRLGRKPVRFFLFVDATVCDVMRVVCVCPGRAVQRPSRTMHADALVRLGRKPVRFFLCVDATVCDVMRVVCVCPGRAVQRPSRTMLMQMRSYVLGENPFVFFSVSTQPCATSCASFAFVPDAPVQRPSRTMLMQMRSCVLGESPFVFFSVQRVCFTVICFTVNGVSLRL